MERERRQKSRKDKRGRWDVLWGRGGGRGGLKRAATRREKVRGEDAKKGGDRGVRMPRRETSDGERGEGGGGGDERGGELRWTTIM